MHDQDPRLTSIVDPEDIDRLHFLDALLCLRAGIPPLTRLIDVGSGAGLPGVPLKIARPDLRIIAVGIHRQKGPRPLSSPAGIACTKTPRCSVARLVRH